ncbi:MAG: hypothetical protein AB7K24_10105 [Gemmataceae bacterium]
MSLMMGILGWDSVRNGQATVLMGGLMMHALVDLYERRWSCSALWLCLGFALKPLILVLMLLVAALYRETRWRLAVGMVLVFVLPFAMQQPHYVLEQYLSVRQGLGAATKLAAVTYWTTLFGVLRVFGFEFSHAGTLALSACAAVLTLAVAWRIKARLSPQETCILLFTLAAGYLMLFNPRTENNTYGLLGPALALAWAHAWHAKRYGLATAHFVLALGIAFSYEVGRRFTPPEESIWLAPSCCLLFLLMLPLTYGFFASAGESEVSKPEFAGSTHQLDEMTSADVPERRRRAI